MQAHANPPGLPEASLTDVALLAPTQALTRGFVQAQALPAAAGASDAGLADVQYRQGFRVAALRLMVRYEDGSELTELPGLHRLPNAPHWLAGIANLHGMLLPVFDLAGYIGLDAQPHTRPMLLVLSHGVDAAGVVIDGLPQRLRWSRQDAADAATAPARLLAHVRHDALVDGQLWFDLDCASLLDALEQALGGLQ